MPVRMYEENEIHECKTCGLMLQVSLAAVPIEPLICCGSLMAYLKKHEKPEEVFDLTQKPVLPNAKETIYTKGEKYTCSLCGIEVLILRTSQPIDMLDCCGEGMELMN